MVQPLEGFLVSVNSPTYGLAPPLPSPLPLRICLQGSTSRGFAPAMSIRQARLSFCVTPSVPNDGIGMLTDCPSPTAFALGLGPTNPPRMTLAAEPSDLRRQRFSLCSRYSSQHSLFQSLHRSSPSGFAVMERSSTKSPSAERLAPIAFECDWRLALGDTPTSAVSVRRFSPVIFSAQEHLTSELLRTL